MDPSSLLQRVALREPGALEQLLEVTHEEALRRVGGDLERLLTTYQSMLDHLREVGPRTDFWTWFGRIAGESRSGSAGSTSSDEARLALQQALRVPDQERSPDSWTEVLGRSMLNGWLPGYGVFQGAALGAQVGTGFFPPSDEWVTLFFALQILAALGASGLAAFLGPWLAPWRRALGGRGFLLAALLLSAVQVLCLMTVLPALIFMLGIAEGAPLPRLLNHLDEWVAMFTPALWGAAFLGGLLLSLLGRPFVQRAPWLTYRHDSWWRKLMTVVFSLPILGVLMAILPLLTGGRSVDPEILALEASWRAGNDDAKRWSHQFQSEIDGTVPSEPMLSQLRQSWKGRFWEDPRTLALAALYGKVEMSRPGARDLELAIRVLTLRPELAPALLNYSLETVPADAGQLSDWVDIILSRADLGEPVRLDEKLWGSCASQALLEIDSQDRAGKHFRALYARLRLNQAWHDGFSGAIRAGLPAILVRGLEEEKRNRQRLAETLLRLEMTRLSRSGTRYPGRVEDLRPEVARLLQAYDLQIELCSEGDCWEIRRAREQGAKLPPLPHAWRSSSPGPAGARLP